MTQMPIPYGYCHCGCGEKTQRYSMGYKGKAALKGTPRRYIKGHHTRLLDGGPEARFWARVKRKSADECWEWLSFVNPAGYGRTRFAARQQLAHRIAYELTAGPVPDALHLDHLCRNRACCNPAHLEPVTPAENNRRIPADARRNQWSAAG